MNGKAPLKNRSPMWTTLAPWKKIAESPSVWACGWCRASIASPFQWRVTPCSKVTTGRASGAAWSLRPTRSAKSAGFIRRRTFSWATMRLPAFPRFSLPPVWSPCQWVLTTKRTGSLVIERTAARILSVSGAY